MDAIPKEVLWLGFLVQLGLFVKLCIGVTRWVYKRTRNNEINRQFVHDMATNHLPHIYDAQKLIAAKMGIKLPPPPPIQFMELNGHRSREADDDEG